MIYRIGCRVRKLGEPRLEKRGSEGLEMLLIENEFLQRVFHVHDRGVGAPRPKHCFGGLQDKFRIQEEVLHVVDRQPK